jgi:L-alanine-DL-glutamate epimerase-like enolase superfamily enzyme
MTGEDIFALNGSFRQLIDERSVDIAHPDPGSSGGILEKKRIVNYSEENGLEMAFHMAGMSIIIKGGVHCAAATQNFLSLKHDSVEVPYYKDVVYMTTAIRDHSLKMVLLMFLSMLPAWVSN